MAVATLRRPIHERFLSLILTGVSLLFIALRYLIALATVVLVTGLLYYFGPNTPMTPTTLPCAFA